MRRIGPLACVALFVLAACQPNEQSGAPIPAVVEQKAAALEKNAAAGREQSDPSRSELIGEREVQVVDPAGTEQLDDAITCLARTIYWEARGEKAASMEAVASVVMNRLGNKEFPDNVCAVVRQGNEQGACQFSWWCDGRSDRAQDDESYATAKEIARKALNLQLRDRTDGALYFHHRNVSPGWSKKFRETKEIGDFIFYTP